MKITRSLPSLLHTKLYPAYPLPVFLPSLAALSRNNFDSEAAKACTLQLR